MKMERYNPVYREFAREGRFDQFEEGCELWWSGSGVRTKLDCTRLELEADAPEGEHTPWLAVTVDGAPVARFAMHPGRHRYDILGGMEKGVTHEISITRDTQPTEGEMEPVALIAVYTDGVPEAPQPRPRAIEFLGDSLTVGEGTVGPVDAMEWRMAWISHQFAFPTLVAEALNAEKRVVALGGWGAYKSYDGDVTHTIGAIYERLCPIVRGGDMPNSFACQRPADAVVINLGTNDASALSGLEGDALAAELAAFEASAAGLLELVRGHNPGAPVLWAYGLCGDAMAAPIQRAIDRRRRAGDDRVFYLPLDDCKGDLGSRSHPSRRAHARAAEQIADMLRRIWEMS